ncbi:hypothetical protein ASE63_25760 [Bosea sp. Root381]|nr:hypothetical protein ASE63_25760 [Bosea sp. Root381]
MIFEWMADPAAWAGLLTLIVLEIVLGIDNLVFIAILADKLPEHQREKARIIGLSLALLMRLVLLASIAWIVTLTQPLFTALGTEISWRDVILIVGGVFLIFKGTMELHERLEGDHGSQQKGVADAVFWQVIAQIVVLDAVFSLDSVITAVGMVRELSIMVIGVIVAMGVMLLASKPLMAFVSRHPTVVILCLGFLLMIGFSLVVEGLGFHIPKGYLYAAIGFSILIEAANQLGRRNVVRRVSTMDLRSRTAGAVLRLLRGGQEDTRSPDEMAALVSSDSGQPAFTPQESSMIERVLTLAERPARAIMVPRVDVLTLHVEDSLDDILRTVRDSGRSRFPLFRGDDEILGVLHAKDLLALGDRPVDLTALARVPVYVIETTPILGLLEQFQASSVHMAMVIDEHGSFEGVVTPTDILIAIAGDLPEHAGDEIPYLAQGEDGTWAVDGRTPIDELEQALHTEFGRTGDATTAAGLVLTSLARLPDPGESVQIGEWEFEVVEVLNRRIANLRVKPLVAA